MSGYGIRVLRLAGLGVSVTDVLGPGDLWVRSFDADAFDGRGDVAVTTFPSLALRFDSQAEAFECWQRQSTVRPLREDGKPNRPLTAYTVEIRPLP